MKKLFSIFAALFISATASAQVYKGLYPAYSEVYRSISSYILTTETTVTLNSTYSETIVLADGETATLSNATFQKGIICLGNATLILEGSNTVSCPGRNNTYYGLAGIQIGPANTTLTIKGSGSLTVDRSNDEWGISTGIGNSSVHLNSFDYTNREGGNIVIEGGTITAIGGCDGGAGIGAGVASNGYTNTMGDIIIKGGTIKAIGGSMDRDRVSYGIGKAGSNSNPTTVGRIIIYDGVTMVSAAGRKNSDYVADNGFSESVIYMHGDDNVTAKKDKYFTVGNSSDNYKVVKPNYVVSVADGVEHGTIVASPDHVTKGISATVTLTVTPDEGYKIGSVAYNNGSNHPLTPSNGVCSFSLSNADVTVSATFTAVEYGITYNGVEGAIFATANPTKYTVESDVITLGNPTKNGYTFRGWTFDGQSEPTTTATIAQGSIGKKEFTAKWAKILTASNIAAIPNQTYTGEALTPATTVKDGTTTLKNGTDYTVEYSNNKNVGTAKVKITGKGNYSGNVEKTFTINTKALTANGISIAAIPAQTYSGSVLTPATTVKDGTTTLVKGTDYTVEYSNNKNVGTAKVKITGKGNYSGNVEKTFTINKALPEYTLPTLEALNCNTKLSDITLPTGFAFEENSAKLSIGENKCMLVFTPEDVENYEIVNNIEITIIVKYHEYGEPVYTWSEDGKSCSAKVVCKNEESHVVEGNATITSEVTTAATVEAKGITTYTATFENDLFSTQTKAVEDIEKLNPNQPEQNPEQPENPEQSEDLETAIYDIVVNSNVKIWSYEKTIYVENAAKEIVIVDMAGRIVKTVNPISDRTEIQLSKGGIYVVKSGIATKKVSVQ